MNYGRLVLAVVTMTTMVLGDCSVGYARCRLLRRRAQKRCVPCAQTGVVSASAWYSGTYICPRQETPYYAGETNGVKYYMYYATVYDPLNNPTCGGMPQPAYLPAGVPPACGSSSPCWDPSRYGTRGAPDYLVDHGHEMSQKELEDWGTPFKRHWINFRNSAGADWRKIDFHVIYVTGYAEPLLVGLENPYGDDRDYSRAPITHTQGGWQGHAFGRTVDRTGFGALYYVLLKHS